ncbi:MAG: endonuclease/exonuclease/phosphatase family protein [bacterium]
MEKNTVIKTAAALIAVMLTAAPLPGKDRKTWDIDKPVTASFATGEVEYTGEVQVIAFNIERGFFWEDVAAYIEKKREQVPATIVLLSECDRNHHRTGDEFVARKLASRLGMNMAYVTEFIEYNDKTVINQGDHGNAILSPFPLSNLTVIRHTSAFSWQKYGFLQGEPRFGERVTLGATVELPGGDKLRVYSVHFESNAGSFEKWEQMKEVLRDTEYTPYPVVIGGDFNEMSFGVMFRKLGRYAIQNSFAENDQPTGGCEPGEGGADCRIKIDWLVHRDLELVKSTVDYPLNSEGGIISDHAPVRAVYRME